MIKKIIHIADVHIPNSEQNKPYSEMFKSFLCELMKEVEGFSKDEIRIVIVGDVFQQKIRITNEAKRIFHELLNYLNTIAKTVIVAGNHDMLENNKDRLDSISPTFDIANVYKNITYADMALKYKSGCIVDDNVIWVLYSMFDDFNRPDIEAVKKKYPDNKVIGLYHGSVVGATTDLGYMSDSGIDTDVFSECDCVMAGHIHKFQTIKKKGVPIVYPSSLFQQKSDENITNHGFVVWNLNDMSYNIHEVPNKWRILRFKISSYEDVNNNDEKLINL